MLRYALAAAFLVLAGLPALAQLAPPEKHSFEGGVITITETDGGEKELAFDGRLIASNFMVHFDRFVDVGGKPVALVLVGDGGNACGASTVILWRGETEIEDEFVGGDCGGPPASVSDDAIVFVPYLNPGQTGAVVQRWTPTERLHTFGTLSYAPQADTGWADLEGATFGHPLDLFRNAAVYEAASALLGTGLMDYSEGLGTATAPERIGDLIVAHGCVPHSCSLANSFIAIDPSRKAVYLARQDDEGAPSAWPAVATWPKAAVDAMEAAIGR